MVNSDRQNDLPILVAFDFDGTLTTRDSLIPFVKMTVGLLRFWWGIVILSPVLIKYFLRLIPNWQAKEAFFTHYLSNLTEEQLTKLGNNFAEQNISTLLRPEALQRLRWHQNQGHKVVLVSASLEAYLVPWGKKMGFDHVIGTKIESQSGIITGKIQGKNCYGQEKVDRLRAMIGDLDNYSIYAYGDSKGDKELLSLANYSYYKTFPDPQVTNFPARVVNWEKGLIISVIASASIYLALVLWSGADQFWNSLNLLPFWLIPVLLGIIFFSYCLRFCRWRWYLNHMGYSVPWKSNFTIFLASFALTASPGKAGESIKSFLLKSRHNIPVSPTLAGLFCERFTDALSVVLLACVGLLSLMKDIPLYWAIFALAAVQLGIILLLQNPQLLKSYLLKPLKRFSKLRGLADKLYFLVDSANKLLQPKLLIGSTIIALIAWGLEGMALYYIFQYLQAESVTLYQAILIHTASGLIGAISMLPGGIGTMEASAVSLSIIYGATQTQAIVATFLIRLLTLWFAVAVGILAMLFIQNKPSAAGQK